MRSKLALLAVVSMLLALGAGCPKETPPAVVKAGNALIESRDSVTVLIPRIKKAFKETDPNYIQARGLYDKTMAANNAWVHSLKMGIQDNQDLDKSAAFKEQAQKAIDATDAFLKCGKTLTEGGVRLYSLSIVGGAEIVKILVENGITIWKAYHAENEAGRLAKADRYAKELMWKTWEEVK